MPAGWGSLVSCRWQRDCCVGAPPTNWSVPAPVEEGRNAYLMARVPEALDLHQSSPKRRRSEQAFVCIFKAGVLYFALVFGMGLVLGTIRVLWLPRFGMRGPAFM